MPVKHLDITILAKVVDNFGDIGVTWRLARNLNYCAKRNSENYSLNIRLITDNLVSFNKINSKINPLLPFQECEEIKIYDWGNYEFCYNSFTKNTPDLILECFQCGNPDWLEKILFEDRVEDHPVNIIMIDYLSAEPWVSDFHCLKSLTRTASVPKVNFMPGFAKKTGGLLINEQWTMNNGQYKNGIIKNLNQRSNEKTNCQLSIVNCQFKQVLFFAYPQDWSPVIRAMNRVFVKDTCVKVAAGAGQESILKSCCENNSVFTPEKLSFMDQEDWDKMMHDMDFMIIRGEDSMAQACLTGTPFIWQAYPQKDEYQLVKVNALLNRMRNHFGKEFRYVETAWNAINKTEHTDNAALEENVFDFLKNLESLKPGFISFAKSLYENGDLADNLMTFILKSIRIEKINT